MTMRHEDAPEAVHVIQTFGHALRFTRMRAGLSFQQIANNVGARKGDVRRWEKDEAIPTRVQLRKLYSTLKELRYYTDRLPPVLRVTEEQEFNAEFEKAKKKIGDVAFTNALGPRVTDAEIIAAGVGTLIHSDAWEPPRAAPDEKPPPPFPRALTFHDALRLARLAAGLGQEELGELVGVVAQAVSHWELGVAVPIQDHYDKLIEVFPHLTRAPKPASRDMEKPGKPAGSSPPPTPTPTSTTPTTPSTWKERVAVVVSDGASDLSIFRLSAFDDGMLNAFVERVDALIAKLQRMKRAALGVDTLREEDGVVEPPPRVDVVAHERAWPVRVPADLKGIVGLGARYAAALVETMRAVARRDALKVRLDAADREVEERKFEEDVLREELTIAAAGEAAGEEGRQ